MVKNKQKTSKLSDERLMPSKDNNLQPELAKQMDHTTGLTRLKKAKVEQTG